MAKINNKQDYIKIRGARVHNLKNIDLDIPKNKLVVITGLSGSGKSSLAFDTIYAEAERRFVESLSAYARQFLGIKEKPEVESIEGLSPAISIDQKSVSRNPRSTVGTITETYDYMRILFARLGKPHCPSCMKPVGKQTVEEIIKSVYKLPKNAEILILAPLIRGQKGEHKSVLEEVKRSGFIRARIDGEMFLLEDAPARSIDKNKKHSIEVLVDRFVISKDIETSRIRDSLETALKIGKGIAIVGYQNKEMLFSESLACMDCDISLPVIEPRTFSFNSPYGACSACTGLGSTLEVDTDLVMPNKNLSIAEGAIRPWAGASHRVGRQSWYWWILTDLAERYNFSLNKPVAQLSPDIIEVLLHGEEKAKSAISNFPALPAGRQFQISKKEESFFEGVIANLKRRWKETDSEFTRAEIEKYMKIEACGVCLGHRLRKEALAVKIGAENISSVAEKTIEGSYEFFRNLLGQKIAVLNPNEIKIAQPLVKEITKRLEFLKNVGLEYLTLSRESTTLAGGEAQRIQLATQIGSRLTGVIYVLDEPSIGLHARDHARLLATLKELRDLGNTVLVVEHDAETMRAADWIIDLGLGAGKHGGKIIFEGTPKELLKAKTLTGEYLSGKKTISSELSSRASSFRHPERSEGSLRDSSASPQNDRRGKEQNYDNKNYLIIKNASEHNLKNINVKIPLGKFVCVSGVSGSGKSTLVNDILAKALLAKFYKAHVFPGKHEKILGIENLDKVIVVDQSPIGRTPRSNPATYTGAFGFIRSLLSSTIEAKARGYEPGRFSFNVKGGRCETCEGQGVKKIEMYFLPDVYVECEECRGLRYNREALEIDYHGKNIAEILDLSVEEALYFFDKIPAVKSKLETLNQVGLGYLKLGQSAPTLSGGEAQRVKLATELSRRDSGKTLYILDEPTTGLHFDDIRKLLLVLKALVEKGNTVLLIEHNLDVLRCADWVIDLGPEGGGGGGMIVAEGTPEEIEKYKKSYTGKWLGKETS
ncbi:MAG: excinuclease ABC subunit UvrA [bacterium]|nr:excinuclease ABC subunit UvrA [bacterium]